ncbi:MAG: hypothetical protein CM15mV12_2960 [uncultured marine virus]|nr:MAG: hypothetical protein CM15mV12_2960 [uncultured marine virus]
MHQILLLQFLHVWQKILVGEVFALHADTISDANNTLLDNINNFLDDLQSQLGKISGLLGGSVPCQNLVVFKET